MAAPDVTADALRPLVFSIALRMVGSAGEAEDLVQEAYLRLHREGDVRAPKAFLTTVVTRLAIDHLRSARVRRETYTGDWLPEPLVSAPGTDEQVERDETVSIAFLVLLERLEPVERAVYVLHELLGFAHEEIAPVVGKSVPNCRQILRRAKQHVDAGRPRFEPSRERREALLARFLAAVRGGDVDGLVGLLAADAVHVADGGGKARATQVPILGGDKVARLWAAFGQRPEAAEVELVAVDVNGQPGVAALGPDGALVVVITRRRRRRPHPARLGGAQPGQAGRRGGGAGRGTGRSRAARRLVQRHVRLGAVHPALAHAGSAAVQRVDLADAVAQRELAPVARVQVLLQLVRGHERGDRADLAHPLAAVRGAGRRPVRHAGLLEQADGVLAQPVAGECAARVHHLARRRWPRPA